VLGTKNDFKAPHLEKARHLISFKHESPSKTTATNEEQRRKHFLSITSTKAGMEMLRNEEQLENARRLISRSCNPFGKIISEIHLQGEKQHSPIISTEVGIAIWIAWLKHRIATVRDLFRMNPFEKVRNSFLSSIITVSMPESSNTVRANSEDKPTSALRANSLKKFGRKSDLRAEHPEKAHWSISFREEDGEISIDDNFSQLQKAW
jgi:hypothetical protein